ncbi:MAG: DUF349 domain-containing protein [Paludibacteraceae bacterium]|nr:DUF349 domain-containing protein [Paludibacteraceae bacterium]
MENDKQSLVDELKALLEQNVTEVKDQVEELKVRFYRRFHEEQAALKQAAEEAAAANGETLENWQPSLDQVEVQFRELLNVYKEKKAEVAKQIEAEQEQNLLRKENILAQMKDLAQAETADVMGNLQKMRDLQAEWKTIGAVPAPKAQEIWKEYQQYQEQFYDLVKINIELRDLDFKKNLEMKTLLCEAAEKLKDNPSVVEASRALQQLHDEWAEIGPVARELREDLWNRFKEASSVINKKHQAYFDQIHAKEQENLEKKQALIARVHELLDAHRDEAGEYTIKSNKVWDEISEQLQGVQTEWRAIGFAPKKQNQAIYDEYRALTDGFFRAKAQYYKSIRDVFSENLRRKRELLAKVEELRASENWQNATSQIVALQKEWKTIGPVARKYSDEIWKQFTAVCDDFFNKKREMDKAARGERRKAQNEKMIQTSDKNKLMRIYENLQQEIKTAENNILFFTGKSKTANRLVDDMQKKIDDLKAQLIELEKKLSEE